MGEKKIGGGQSSRKRGCLRVLLRKKIIVEISSRLAWRATQWSQKSHWDGLRNSQERKPETVNIDNPLW